MTATLHVVQHQPKTGPPVTRYFDTEQAAQDHEAWLRSDTKGTPLAVVVFEMRRPS